MQSSTGQSTARSMLASPGNNWQSPLSINVPNNGAAANGSFWADSDWTTAASSCSKTGTLASPLAVLDSGPFALSSPTAAISISPWPDNHNTGEFTLQCCMPKKIGCIDPVTVIAKSNALLVATFIKCKHETCGFMGMVHNNCIVNWNNIVDNALKQMHTPLQNADLSTREIMRKFYACPKCDRPSLIRPDWITCNKMSHSSPTFSPSSPDTTMSLSDSLNVMIPGCGGSSATSSELCSPGASTGNRRIGPQYACNGNPSMKRHSATGSSQYQSPNSPTPSCTGPFGNHAMTNGQCLPKRQISLSGSGRGVEQYLQGNNQNVGFFKSFRPGIDDQGSAYTSGFVSADCPSLSSLSLSTASYDSPVEPQQQQHGRTLRSISEHNSVSPVLYSGQQSFPSTATWPPNNVNISNSGQAPVATNPRLSAGNAPLNSASWRPANLPCVGRRATAHSGPASSQFGSVWSPNEASDSLASSSSSLISPQGLGPASSGLAAAKPTGKFANEGLGLLLINEKGNIFQQRKNVDNFQLLPNDKQNTYFIQFEDDSCTGNEDLRTFLLTQLTNKKISELPCISCGRALVIYDHFPVLDGLLFLSPICHSVESNSCSAAGGPSTVNLGWNSQMNANFSLNNSAAGTGVLASPVVPPPGCSGPRQQQSSSDSQFHHRPNNGGRNGGPIIRQERHLHALCLGCSNDLVGQKCTKFNCKFCGKAWNGSAFLVGGVYTYDVFAAQPCCHDRLKCKTCGQLVMNQAKSSQLRNSLVNSSQEETPNEGQLFPLPYFSQYSMRITCQQCNQLDYHFVRDFNSIYNRVLLAAPASS